MASEIVSFYSGYKLKLWAKVYLPEAYNSAKKYPAVVNCPGFRHGMKEYDFRIEPMLSALAKAGYIVLYFHHRGFGLSDGPRYRLIPWEQVEDIQNAISYLETRDDVDSERIGLYGVSFGGATTPYAAALDERVKCAVAATGVGDGEEWLRSLRRESEWRKFVQKLNADGREKVTTGNSKLLNPQGGSDSDTILPLDPDSLSAEGALRRYDEELEVMRMPLEVARALINFKPVDVVHRISPRAILYIAAENDRFCSPRGIIDMYRKTGQPKDLVILRNQTHRSIFSYPEGSSYETDRTGGGELIRIMVNYFNKYLGKNSAESLFR